MKKIIGFIFALFLFLLPSHVYASQGTFAVPTSWDGSAGEFILNSSSFSPSYVGDCGNNTDFGSGQLYSAITHQVVRSSSYFCPYFFQLSSNPPSGKYYITGSYGGDTWTSGTFCFDNSDPDNAAIVSCPAQGTFDAPTQIDSSGYYIYFNANSFSPSFNGNNCEDGNLGDIYNATTNQIVRTSALCGSGMYLSGDTPTGEYYVVGYNSYFDTGDSWRSDNFCINEDLNFDPPTFSIVSCGQ